MSTPFNKEEVLRIANLARLSLTDSEADAMTQDMLAILNYVHRLEELNTKEIAPTSHAISLPTHFRSDDVLASLPLDQSLKNAPERMGDGVGVPKIIE